MTGVQSSAGNWPHTRACTNRCTTTIEDSTSIGCNFAHEKTKSEILIDFWLKMAMFAVSSVHSNYDRPLDYHFSKIHHSWAFHWHSWNVCKSAHTCAWCKKAWFWHNFTFAKFLSRAHQCYKPSLPYMVVLLSSHYGMIAATTMDLHSCMSESDRQKCRKLPISASA